MTLGLEFTRSGGESPVLCTPALCLDRVEWWDHSEDTVRSFGVGRRPPSRGDPRKTRTILPQRGWTKSAKEGLLRSPPTRETPVLGNSIRTSGVGRGRDGPIGTRGGWGSPGLRGVNVWCHPWWCESDGRVEFFDVSSGGRLESVSWTDDGRSHREYRFGHKLPGPVGP